MPFNDPVMCFNADRNPLVVYVQPRFHMLLVKFDEILNASFRDLVRRFKFYCMLIITISWSLVPVP